MLKEAIEKIESMVERERTININGVPHSTRMLSPVIFAPEADTLNVNSLKGFCEFIALNTDGIISPKTHFIHVEDYLAVHLLSTLTTPKKTREELVYAKAPALGNPFKFGEYYSQEDFIIKLRTLFVPRKDTDVDYLLSYTSKIVTDAKVEGEDDGVSQKVTVKRGVSGVLQDKMSLKPIVRLAPFRTFREVEQPESDFLFRVKEGGHCALFEADGGCWKLKAVENIVAYLKENAGGIPVIA